MGHVQNFNSTHKKVTILKKQNGGRIFKSMTNLQQNFTTTLR